MTATGTGIGVDSGQQDGHGDPAMYRLPFGEWIRKAFGLEPPKYARMCMFRSRFPCNGHCWMEHRCMVAERVRESDARSN